jgi:hypothetical protein
MRYSNVKHQLQIAAAVLALAACGSIASAQTAQTAPAPSSRFGAMRQMHAQMRQIETQARTQIIGSLTPAHRALLANVVGQLAISSTPDFRSAAQRLDAALSPNEKQAILSAETSARSQMRTAFQQMRSQMPPPPAGASPPARAFGGPGGPPGRPRGERRPPDAGAVLLHTAMRVAMVRR